MAIDFFRPAFSVCIRFGVCSSLCELRSSKSELNGDGPLGAMWTKEDFLPSHFAKVIFGVVAHDIFNQNDYLL